MIAHAVEFTWGIWLTIAAAWLLGACQLKPAARREDRWPRIAELLLLAVFVSLWMDPSGLLQGRWLPLPAVLAPAGIAVAACGAAFTIMARACLGQNWSATATIERGHELVLVGPYRLVRHPIYTGMFVTVIGTAMASGELRHLLVVPLVLLAFWIKARAEERLLLGEFGDQYARYRHEVRGAILPVFWGCRGQG